MFFSFCRQNSFACIALAVSVLFFIVLLSMYYVPAYDAMEDENGYMVTARLLATTGDSGKHLSDPYEFVSGNWVETQDNVYYAKYPIGYPLLCAIAYPFFGGFLVNPVLAVLGVIGIFFLGRILIGDMAGIFAAILLGTNPLYALYALSCWSHTAAACFSIWGMFFIWKWTRQSSWWNGGLGAGFLTYSVTVRYTEALMILPFLAMLTWCFIETYHKTSLDQRREATISMGKQLLIMILVGLFVAAPMLIHQWLAFGAPWITGYALCNETTAFGWKWFTKNFQFMHGRMNAYGMAFLFPLGLAGLVYLTVCNFKKALFLGLWIVPGLILYTSYYGVPRGNNPLFIRFFLPIFPPLILSAFFLLYRERSSLIKNTFYSLIAGCLVLFFAGTNLQKTLRELDWQKERLLFTKAINEVIREKVPQGSVIFALSNILQFTEYCGDFYFYSQTLFLPGYVDNLSLLLQDRHSPDVIQRKRIEKMTRLLGGKTEAQLAQIMREILIRHLNEGRKVFMIVPDEFSYWNDQLKNQMQLKCLARNMREPYWMPHTPPDGRVPSRFWSLYSLELRNQNLK